MEISKSVAAPKTLDMNLAAAVRRAANTAWQCLFDHGGPKAGRDLGADTVIGPKNERFEEKAADVRHNSARYLR